MACVYIPVQNSDEEVKVNLDELPLDASYILDILKAEQAPLDIWLIIAACVHFSRGQYVDSLQLCKGDYGKAGMYYMASIKKAKNPHEFALPCYGLGQVQLKLGDLQGALTNFEIVLEVQPKDCGTLKALGHIYVQLGQNEKAQELFRKATKIDPQDPQYPEYTDANLRLAAIAKARNDVQLSVKLYQNCLRKFYYNTQSEVLLYLARVHYEAQQWQDCRKTLLRAIHLDPSNYTLRFDVGVAIQKSSALTLQMTMRTVDEVRATVGELRNAIRLFSLLCASSNLHFHGLDEKKIRTHVGYCSHLLEAACADQELAELEEQQNLQRLEVRRQIEFAEIRFG
ncbi:UNVERIFIED_CONTAM: protein CTR9 [Sesamum angustifolium]|uniref:Protein CTR9 n=1 Tax=Sesamum angustifolium TaxID=2727405 RepID=A0AAW2N622_9LAMI